MSLFFPNIKKIYKYDFKKALRNIPQLSPTEQAYVQGVFQDSLKNGLSKAELKKEISQLKRNSSDPLDSFEVEKLKKKLMQYF
ncbi:hypothetical protein KKE74_03675 [Patescibacteria group bacterium]|nr:hypothetical protein [Patescibacteria group bacterium]MBU2473105.1 hypothetical protein [Patescibacteria group bacterium]